MKNKIFSVLLLLMAVLFIGSVQADPVLEKQDVQIEQVIQINDIDVKTAHFEASVVALTQCKTLNIAYHKSLTIASTADNDNQVFDEIKIRQAKDYYFRTALFDRLYQKRTLNRQA